MPTSTEPPKITRIRVGRDYCTLDYGAIVPRLIRQAEYTTDVALTAGYAVLLDGDHIALQIDVDAGCRLTIREIGGTVAYPTPRCPSSWQVSIRLAENAQLVWAGQPFIVTDDATVRRSTNVLAHPTSIALIRETIVLGRYGEHGGRADSRFEARLATGRPVIIEHTRLDGRRPSPLTLGENKVLDSVHLLGTRLPADLLNDNTLLPEEPAAVERFVGLETHLSSLPRTWDRWLSHVDALQAQLFAESRGVRAYE